MSGLIRYGYEGGGPGREGKWDIAMLERNGLRHGGFELREGADTWKDGKVRGMSWNADSEVLAVWVERRDKDVGELPLAMIFHLEKRPAHVNSTIVDNEKLPLLPQTRDIARGARTEAV